MATRPSSLVGSLAWERAGGPALTLGQRAGTLCGAAGVILGHWAGRVGLARGRRPVRIDLTTLEPPDSAVARAAEEELRALASPEMVGHSLRTYWFSAMAHAACPEAKPIDREALYVAAVMHDVGLFEPDRPVGEICFTVAGARRARALMSAGGWEASRQDRVAMAITSNLEASVPIDAFGPEAHWMSAGGIIEVLAQGWRVHPDNLAEILARHPRSGFAHDVLGHVRRDVRRNPGGRFACLDPLFPWMVRRAEFDRMPKD